MQSRKRIIYLNPVLPILIVSLFCLLSMVSTGLAALTNVICVPWQGDINKYHTTWSGQQIILKGVIKTSTTDPIWYKWSYGDGTESAISSLSAATKYNVETPYTYTGASGTPFIAKLIAADNNTLTGAIEDPYLVMIQDANLDSKINVAIDNGLWFLYKSQFTNSSTLSLDGSSVTVWGYDPYYASPTASALQAFEINGHKATGNPNQDPYVESVALGLNWLLKGYVYNTSYPMLQAQTIGIQHGTDNPDTNGNGIGIQVRDYGYRPAYEGGMVMDAIIASGTPDADSGRDFDGDGKTDTYRQVVQDMCDMFAWGQHDYTANGVDIIGGWRYSWGDWPDNSACQWAAIGMIAAQQQWNCTVPEWVKTYNNTWLNYSFQAWTDSGRNWGGFGYTGSGWGHATTPSGMVQLDFCGIPITDDRWVRCEQFFADNWDTYYNWLGQNNVYGYYAFAKAMRLANPQPVVTFSSNNFDWYRGNALSMGLAEKVANVLVANSYWDYYGPVLGTAWSVIILKPILFAEAPIACFDANPNPSFADSPINFDPSCSGHSQPGKDITNLTKFEWDWNNDGIYEESTATPAPVIHQFSCDPLPCTYPVKLRVTDDNVPARTATYVRNIQITNPPHPPVALTKGPLMVSLCSGDELTLDGSQSYDPDAGLHEAGCDTCPNDSITEWAWDFDGAPWTYVSATGAIQSLGTAFTTYFPTAGTYPVGLRVTDNTLLSYPSSGQPNLTDEAFTDVAVYNGCICTLTAQATCRNIHLSWDDIGAEKYTVYVSTTGPNIGFRPMATDTTNYEDYDEIVMGVKTYFRVMAITGNTQCLSNVLAVTADPQLCTPTANPGGPYSGCIGEPVTIDGSGSTAQVGTIVTWEWDLDNDGQYDDALGQTIQYTWNTPGTYTIGLKVTSSDSLVLYATAATTVEIKDCHPTTTTTTCGHHSTTTTTCGHHSTTTSVRPTTTTTVKPTTTTTISGCTYAIYPHEEKFKSSGGQEIVIVLAQRGCAWTASSNNPTWITIKSGASGVGTGYVKYTVTANKSTTSRTGTMLIAGKKFTVQQAGMRK
jgi:hypothetical protein